MKKPGTDIKRILVADDEPAICQLCQRVLTEEGFEVDIAANGREAQSKIGKQEYDLYLFDIKMPVVSGGELYIWLQETNPGSAEKVIFMTGSAIGKDTESFLEASGRPVLLKPFATEDLKAICRQP